MPETTCWIMLLLTGFFGSVGQPCVASPAAQDQPAAANIMLSTQENPRQVTIAALAGAKESIQAVMFKLEDEKILAALGDAMRRGVAVKILLDGRQANHKDSLARRLASLGGEIRVWPRERGEMHAKFVMIDGREVLAGSYNWTVAGGSKNVELLISLKERETVAIFNDDFHFLWQQGRLLSP